ncbi:MAG: hypothetical protein KKF56_00995 [Nanoarchaeota archaeon]|nr:hypothetical protein [Nanoarchaeota archaeon]
MKKIGAILIVIVLMLSLYLVIADDTDTATDDDTPDSTGVDRAYTCLETEVNGNCADLTDEAKAFALMALSYNITLQQECKNALLASVDTTNNCWPANACKLKETALATIALYRINVDTTLYEEWLITQNRTDTDLVWYLQIESSDETVCQLIYSDTATHTVTIGEDKKISANAGSCLTTAVADYWFKISDNCVDKKYTISCDKDFLTNLLYTKPGSSTVYVSAETHSNSAGGKTEEKINSLCFTQNGLCNYEGGEWAATALQYTGNDIASYLPYLIGLSPENQKFGSSGFLYLLDSSDTYLQELISQQNIVGYWNFVSSTYNKFYDTSLALMALLGKSSEQAEEAKTWLLDNQPTSGCWNSNNVRDTSFILSFGWPRTPVTTPSGTDPTDPTPPTTIDYCTDFNYYCMTSAACTNVNGNVLDAYFCSGLDKCCDQPEAQQQTCSQQGGIICNVDQTCLGNIVSASDSTGGCCKNGQCTQQVTESECDQQGSSYDCKSTCGDNEVEKSFACFGTDLCCKYEPTPPDEGGSTWWIWILILLIILVVVGIIFRDKVKIWFFQAKSKFKKSPSGPGPPRMFSPAGQRPMPRMMTQQGPIGRPIGRPPMRQPVRSQPPKKDEYDETLKKLKEMSK